MDEKTALLLGKMFGGDRESIPYRPRIAKVVGSITGAILLQQVVYRWTRHDQKPFYKFKRPCNHTLYQEGDSWSEELGFSGRAFDTAISKIGVKNTKELTQEQALAQCRRQRKPVLYWITPGRITYYTVLIDVLMDVLTEAYAADTVSSDPQLPKDADRNLAVGDDLDVRRSEKETTSEKEAAAPPLSPETKEPSGKELYATQSPLYWEHEMVDGSDWMHTCERCDKMFDVLECKKSAAECPYCHLPGRVRNPQGTVTHRLPQGVRRKLQRAGPPLQGFGGKPVLAFCRLEKMEQPGPRKRAQFARRFQEIADGKTAEEVADAIDQMNDKFAWKHYGGNPWRRDFENNLLSILLAEEESDSIDLATATEEELEAAGIDPATAAILRAMQ